jgi:hypothetical protein
MEHPHPSSPDLASSAKLNKAKASKKRRHSAQHEGKKSPMKKTRVDQFDSQDVQQVAPIARNHQKMQLATIDPFAEDEILQQFIINSWSRACDDFQKTELGHVINEDNSLCTFVSIISIP